MATVDELRGVLTQRGISTRSTNPGYLARLANATGRQVSAGLTASRQAARGHVTTKEHPTRERGPRLPAAPSAYREASAKYTRGFSGNKLRSADRLRVGDKGAAVKAVREMGRLGRKDVQVVGHTKGGKQLSLTRGKYSQKSLERLFAKKGGKGKPFKLADALGQLMDVVYVDDLDDDELESISIVGY